MFLHELKWIFFTVKSDVFQNASSTHIFLVIKLLIFLLSYLDKNSQIKIYLHNSTGDRYNV